MKIASPKATQKAGKGLSKTTFAGNSSFTADSLARRRTFTDIPYSREIFDILQEIQPMTPEQIKRADDNNAMLPFFEGRYLLTDHALKGSHIKQVLELASGLSPHGFAWTADPAVLYVEFDLPPMICKKKAVVAELLRVRGQKERANLLFVEGNVVKPNDFAKAIEDFSVDKPVFVTFEGLLRYIGFEDKDTLMKNIFNLLKEQGGMCITHDIETLDVIQSDPAAMARYDRMAEQSGFDVRPNLFRNIDQAVSYFRDFGFQVALRTMIGIVDELASPARVDLQRAEVLAQLQHRYTAVLTVPKNKEE